jgi:hypothetical protein
MKTREEFDQDLYERYFVDRNLKYLMYVAMSILFLIGIVIDVAGRMMHEVDHFKTTLGIVGLVFVVAFIIITNFFFFFYSVDIKKEREKITDTLISLKKERECFGEMAVNEAQNHNPENQYQKAFQKIQKKIWTLEFQLKQIGG